MVQFRRLARWHRKRGILYVNNHIVGVSRRPQRPTILSKTSRATLHNKEDRQKRSDVVWETLRYLNTSWSSFVSWRFKEDSTSGGSGFDVGTIIVVPQTNAN